MRKEVIEEIISTEKKDCLLLLPTSYGKTLIALEKMKSLVEPKQVKILIVIPRLVLIQNWKDEITKWGYEQYLPFITFVTYVSFPKKAGKWDIVIFDEVHHLSERCREALESFEIKHSIMLSATVNRNIRYEITRLFPDLLIKRISVREAIEEDILPDPKVYLIPLELDNTIYNHEIIKNKGKKNEITIMYGERYQHREKDRKIIIKCTERQYYDDMSSLILWYKNKMFVEIYKNLYLRKCGERLKWLSDKKTDAVQKILSLLKDVKTLTFCNGIEQTEKLGKYCINSKNSNSSENLDKFNKGKIKHITACNMLDEGVNLTNCQVGIYASLNSSERMIIQKMGRLLRHKEPIIIIPYFKNTRDEEIVNKMMIQYNSENVQIVELKDFKI